MIAVQMANRGVVLLGLLAIQCVVLADPVTDFFHDIDAWCSENGGHETACIAPPAALGVAGLAYGIKYVLSRCRASPTDPLNAKLLSDYDRMPAIDQVNYDDYESVLWVKQEGGWKRLVGIKRQPDGPDDWRKATAEGYEHKACEA